MYTKLYKPMAVVAITTLVLALVALPVFAADQPATSREAAGAPLGGTVRIEPGATHWYKFSYHYDNSQKDNEPSEALVALKMNMPGALSFSIETPANLALPKEDKDGHLRGPVGVGAPMSLKIHNHDGTEAQIDLNKQNADEHDMLQNEGMLIWSGKTKVSETFYVLVKNNRNVPVAYQLTITGPDVSFPTLPVTPAQADVTLEGNKEVARRYVKAMEQADLATLNAVTSPTFVNHSPPLPSDREGMNAFFVEHRNSFTTGEYIIDYIVAEGDLVYIFGHYQGTHDGKPFMGVPASGVKVNMDYALLLRLKDGKVVDRWGTADLGNALMVPLGLLVPPSK